MLQWKHSAILSTFIKPPFVINIFVVSILEWPLKGVYCSGKSGLPLDPTTQVLFPPHVVRIFLHPVTFPSFVIETSVRKLTLLIL